MAALPPTVKLTLLRTVVLLIRSSDFGNGEKMCQTGTTQTPAAKGNLHRRGNNYRETKGNVPITVDRKYHIYLT